MLRSRRLIAALLSASMIFTILPSAVFADGETAEPEAIVEQQGSAAEEEIPEEQVPEENPGEPEEVPSEDPVAVQAELITIDELETVIGTASVDMEDNDELFAGYADEMFTETLDPANGVVGNRVTAGSNLTGSTKDFYDIVVPILKQIADGERASATIEVPGSQVGIKASYTPAELGYGSFSEDNVKEALRKVATSIQVYTGNLLYSLSDDCAYEMYWFEKYMSFGYSSTGRYSPDTLYPDVTFYVEFQVETKFQDASSSDALHTTDTSRTGIVRYAIENAQRIVSDASGMSDYYKLLYYKDTICSMVSYDRDAARDVETIVDRGAWSLVYAFDGDPTTNIVCEGYSEAFQYLCELSTFTNTYVYSVSGNMTGGTGAGLHKWNIVRINGINYLADVTNSDSGTAGSDGRLFLKGASGNVSVGYTVAGIKYTYDNETLSVFTQAELTLSSSSYSIPSQASVNDKVSVAGMSMTLGDTIKANLYAWVNPSFRLKGSEKMYVSISGAPATEYTIKNLPTENGNYVLTIDLTAKEMASDISIYFTIDGSSSQPKTISVKKYANVLLSSTNTSDIASAMLNYGAYAQSYFGYNTSTPANAGIVDNVPSSNPDLSRYVNNVSGASGMALSFYGSSLILKNDTRLKLYFTGGTISTVSGGDSSHPLDYTVGGNTIVIKGITAKELSNSYTLRITDNTGKEMTLTVNPMAYGNKVLQLTGSNYTGLKNLIKALYLYHVEAKEYTV